MDLNKNVQVTLYNSNTLGIDEHILSWLGARAPTRGDRDWPCPPLFLPMFVYYYIIL